MKNIVYATFILILLFSQTAHAVEAEDFEDFSFTDLYDEYFTNQSSMSNWNLLLMVNDFFMNSVGQAFFWGALFAIVYLALHLTTGGISIPAAVFSTTGAVLVSLMPLQISNWVYIMVIIGLFVIPGYKYFKN